MHRPRFILIVGLLALACGCNSGRQTVTGKVTYEDGTPVTAGTVVAEATIDGKIVGIQGNIESDGTFRMGGASPGDGALPGTYGVLIQAPSLSDFEKAQGKKPALGGKYASFDSSGITLEVKPGTNELPIKVERPK
jgi:hypothetical protein